MTTVNRKINKISTRRILIKQNANNIENDLTNPEK